MENKEFQTLIASILIHIALVMILLHAKTPDFLHDEVPVEIVYNDPNKKSNMVVTETEEKDELMDKLKQQTAYLSKLSKRVKEETVARNNEGPTVNRSRSLNLNPTQGAMGQKMAGRETPQENNQGEVNLQKAQSGGGLGRNIAIGDSSIGEYIPNVKEGNFTALNTDQFTFYTFFSRVNEAIRFRWVSRVRNFASNLPQIKQQELAQYGRTSYITIILDPKGSIIRSFVSRSSGSDGLDMAALMAFREAAPFLNPPSEMREPDGTIKLEYSFHVEFRPNTLAGP